MMMNNNLFEQFAGADLDRLVACLQAIKAAGKRVDRYTQAGVNQNSGHVWVWGEDWPGCVYCSIGGDVAWCYSCPDCGDEHDFATYDDMDDYASRYEGCCRSCKPKFVEWSDSGGRIELQIALEDAESASHPGQCDADVARLRDIPYIQKQLDRLPPDLVADCLSEYGAWTAEDLVDHDANLNRLLWIACGDISF